MTNFDYELPVAEKYQIVTDDFSETLCKKCLLIFFLSAIKAALQ